MLPIEGIRLRLLGLGTIAMPSSHSKGYLPTLDVWRAIAVLGLLGDHVFWGNPHLGRFGHIAIEQVPQFQSDLQCRIADRVEEHRTIGPVRGVEQVSHDAADQTLKGNSCPPSIVACGVNRQVYRISRRVEG